MICVYAVAKVKPTYIEKFIKIVIPLIMQTRKEKGNISYNLGKVEGKANTFTFIEQWENEEALNLHLNMPHFLQAGKELDTVLSSPLEINKLEAIHFE